jgi:hypothetical protein
MPRNERLMKDLGKYLTLDKHIVILGVPKDVYIKKSEWNGSKPYEEWLNKVKGKSELIAVSCEWFDSEPYFGWMPLASQDYWNSSIERVNFNHIYLGGE